MGLKEIKIFAVGTEDYEIMDEKARPVKSIEEMKVIENLKAGDIIKTIGYYSANDGGGATYLIREKLETDIEDNGIIHYIDESLVAELIIENNQVNIKQLGGRSEEDTNYSHFDNKEILEKFISLLSKSFNPTLIIPKGTFCFSSTHIKTNYGVHIEGKNINGGNINNTSIITLLNDNSDYIWKIGGNADNTEPTDSDVTKNYSIKNLMFSTKLISNGSSELLHVEKALDIDGIAFSEFENISFYYVDGTGMSIKASWELNIRSIWFTAVFNFDYPKFLIDKCWTNFFNAGADVSAINIDYLYFEAFNGEAIRFENGCRLNHSHINNINIEGRFLENDDVTIGIYSDDVVVTDEIALINLGEIQNTIINNIELSNIKQYATRGDKTYIMKSLFKNENAGMVDVIVNNIALAIFNHKFLIAKLNNKNIRGNIIINNYVQYNENLYLNKELFDITSFARVKINNIVDKYHHNVDLQDTPFLKLHDYVARYGQDGVKQLMSTDSTALNREKIVIGNNGKRAKTTNQSIFILPKITDDIVLRAKIPLGKTCNLYVRGKNQYGSAHEPNISLEGTGDWNWYSLNTLHDAFSGIAKGCMISFVDYTDYTENEEVAQFDVFHY